VKSCCFRPQTLSCSAQNESLQEKTASIDELQADIDMLEAHHPEAESAGASCKFTANVYITYRWGKIHHELSDKKFTSHRWENHGKTHAISPQPLDNDHVPNGKPTGLSQLATGAAPQASVKQLKEVCRNSVGRSCVRGMGCLVQHLTIHVAKPVKKC